MGSLSEAKWSMGALGRLGTGGASESMPGRVLNFAEYLRLTRSEVASLGCGWCLASGARPAAGAAELL